jgi:hypothetical protein
MPKSVPLRAIAVTIVASATPFAGSRMLFPIAIATLRKNWSLPAMNWNARAASPARASGAASSRSRSEVHATLRWCISSPIVRPRAISGLSAIPPPRSALS